MRAVTLKKMPFTLILTILMLDSFSPHQFLGQLQAVGHLL
jgi:hypothetical protein